MQFSFRGNVQTYATNMNAPIRRPVRLELRKGPGQITQRAALLTDRLLVPKPVVFENSYNGHDV
jgi:hypothetical protein